MKMKTLLNMDIHVIVIATKMSLSLNFFIIAAHGLVATVQSQSGVISPSPALASKAPQSVVIQTPVSTMLVTSQTGPVQGQAISGIMQSGASTNVTSSTAGTAVKGLPGSVFNKVPIGPNSQVAVPTQLKVLFSRSFFFLICSKNGKIFEYIPFK